MGFQAHDAKRRRHRAANPPETPPKRRTTRIGSSQFLSDLLDRHFAAHLLSRNGYVTHFRFIDARLHFGVHILVGGSGQGELSIGANARQHFVYTGIHGDAVEIGVPPFDRQSDQDHGPGYVQLGPRHTRLQGAFKGLLGADKGQSYNFHQSYKTTKRLSEISVQSNQLKTLS